MNGSMNNSNSSESISPSTHIIDRNNQHNYTKYSPMEFTESDKAVVSDALANNNKQLLLANLYHYFIECKNYKTAISLLKESDVPLSISGELINQPELLLISSKEKKLNNHIDTYIIEHNSLEIELFENQYIKSKSSMPRDGSFMVQWWDCLWSIYNNVNSQPLELLSSVRPFIDVIKPIFPEHIPVNNAGSPIHPPNLDITSMNISRPDMYTNANLLRNDYPQNNSNFSSPYAKNYENIQQNNVNEDVDGKTFVTANQNMNIPSTANKGYNKMNQKPALHQVRRGSGQSQYSSPHNVNNNMQFNSQQGQQYVSGIPTAKSNNEMKKNIIHRDPKFYPQDGIFRPPSSQKPSLAGNPAVPTDIPGAMYTKNYANGQRMSTQEEFVKQNSSATQQKNMQNNLQYQPGLMNSNVAFNDVNMNSYGVSAETATNGNVQMMQQYQQSKKNSRMPSQNYGSSTNTPTSNNNNNNFGTPGNKHVQYQNYPQGNNGQYFIPGNEPQRMDKMQQVPLSNINEEQEQDYQKALQASEWAYNNNMMKNANMNMENNPKVHDFMELSNVNFTNGMNFHYPAYVNNRPPVEIPQPAPQANMEMYNNLRVSTEVDNTTIATKKPSGKPKGRPKKNATKAEPSKETAKKQTKPKKSSVPNTTKTSSILGKNVYLEDLGDTGIVFQKEKKPSKLNLNKPIPTQFENTFGEGQYLQTNQVPSNAGNSGTSIKFFGNDNFKDIYSMVSGDGGNVMKSERSGKSDIVERLIHNDDFGMNFPPLQSNSNKLISEDNNHQDLLDSFLMQEISGVGNKDGKEGKKRKDDFGNGLNFDLSDQGH